jgi:hypothetical protein
VNIGRTQEEDLAILRDRIIECICREILTNNMKWFHGVDMIKKCVHGFLDEKATDEYQFSGEHPYYKHALERIYRPLIDLGLLSESENNNYWINEDRFPDICRRELRSKEYIKWDDFLRIAKNEGQTS